MRYSMDRADIDRLVAWLNDYTMANLDKESARRLVNALMERLAVYEATETPLQQVVRFNYSNPKRKLQAAIGFGSSDELALACRLIQEELDELREAITLDKYVDAVDALCDLEYVLLNAVAAHGIHNSPGLWEMCFQEVHRSNMSKFTDGVPVFREDGKLLKGPDYSPPNLERILALYGWQGNPRGE